MAAKTPIKLVDLGSGQGALKEFEAGDGIAWGLLQGSISSQTDLQSALDAKSAFGVGQTWQDMTSSRSLSTSYTNSTGKPIMITGVLGPASGAVVTAIATVGSMPIYSTYSAVTGNFIAFNVVVPAGVTYSVAPANGTAALVNWRELR